MILYLYYTSTTGWWRPGLTEVVGEGVRNTAGDVKYGKILCSFIYSAQKKVKRQSQQKYFKKKIKNQPEGCSIQTAKFAIEIALTVLSLTASYR